MGDPNHDYRIDAGGRCYTLDEVWPFKMQIVKCPVCDRIFSKMWAYKEHYQAVHRVPGDLHALD